MTTHDQVYDIETRIDVKRIKVRRFGKEFEIYPWLKGRIFHKLVTGHEAFQKRNFSLYIKQVFSLFYGLWNLFGKYDIWVFTTSMERRYVDGKYIDKLFDYIGNELGYKTLIFELRVYQYIPYRKIASKKAVSRSVIMLVETIYAKLFLRNIQIEGSDHLKELLNTVEGGIDHPWAIRKYLAQYKVMKTMLKWFPNPKLVLLSVSYTNLGYIRAFKEAGIKVVEMQHGVITKNHQAYNYAVEFDPIQFPDVLWTSGECQQTVFDHENEFPTKVIRPVGSYIIDHYRHSHSQRKDTGKKKVLFAMQEGEVGAKLVDFILQLSEQYVNELEIIIQPRRMAPQDYIRKWPELVNVSFSNSNFYLAVGKVDIHSTIYSTTAIEALSLGVPNILINIDNQSKEQLGNEIGNNPYTRIVETPIEFMEALNKFGFVSSSEVIKSNAFNILPDYKKNIKEAINELLA